MTDTQTPRDISICAHAILGDEVFIVPDAEKDDRFADNPLVVGNPNIRFYAGCPLKVGNENLGTLCVIDNKPRSLDGEDQQLLRDLAEMVEQELMAVQQATTDSLTHLSNRRGFEMLARHVLQLCKRVSRPATLLFFDLNGFKEINDTYGHAEGDRALQVFAQGLLEVFRHSDVVGRLGGDEFVVLLSGTDSEHAAFAVARLRAWFEEPSRGNATEYSIRFSVGQTGYDEGIHGSIEELLASADRTMYDEKRQLNAGGRR